ncbi:MAG: YegS/Rv2252/BmrU family lipid kinase [Acidobacteriaceae bacterium]|nr:YegS/Rv2252/BmrU family lipid kinase [Acidobacteriaceae bacterium]
MRKALLLYNPLSGRRHGRRLADVEAAASVLRAKGIDASSAPTQIAGDATAQVKSAIGAGCDTIFACGGDGTIHDVLQGLVGTDAALGVIPLGTANSLAHDLAIPLSPAGAANAALTAKPRRIAVGSVQYQAREGEQHSRYFIVAVGIGVDAHLFYNLNPVAKRHLGMMAYYVKATRLWLTHRMEPFAVEIADGAQPRRCAVSQLLAVRIQDFGGVLRELAPGASLERDDLRFVLFHTRSRAAYLRYVIRGLIGVRWNVPGIELLHGHALSSQPLAGSSHSRIFVEADGEVLGTLPAEITVIPDSLNLLIPARNKP